MTATQIKKWEKVVEKLDSLSHTVDEMLLQGIKSKLKKEDKMSDERNKALRSEAEKYYKILLKEYLVPGSPYSDHIEFACSFHQHIISSKIEEIDDRIKDIEEYLKDYPSTISYNTKMSNEINKTKGELKSLNWVKKLLE